MNEALVIGGGIAGIQASLDMADRGIKVHLVEKSPSIGGVMAQLDKTFPTMDCSICILSPKMIECSRHPNITLHTLSEVVEVKGSAGDFTVKVLKKPRYVDASKCTGCGVCTEKCPTRIPSEFQMGLAETKAIAVPFPQAVPLVARVDGDHCLNLQRGVCRVCEKVCPAGAVDFSQKEAVVDLDVSSIVVATGFHLLDSTLIREYGYGRFKNVLTSLEFERLVCASGPTGGHLVKPSNGETAHRIAFIQCVGSRSHAQGMPYCSAVCCMYATKNAVLVKEHDPGADVDVFYLDLKVYGQGFESFVNRARTHYGVNYVRGRPGEVRENPVSHDLSVWYEDTETGHPLRKEFDLVVLCPAMVSAYGNMGLAKVLGVELDMYGFFEAKDPVDDPIETSVPGIFMCGCSHGPRDIPESVAEASGAAAKVAEIIAKERPIEVPVPL